MTATLEKTNSVLHYDLQSLGDDTILQDHVGDEHDSLPLDPPSNAHNASANRPSFLRTRYQERQFRPDLNRTDMFRYTSWLPVRSTLHGAGGPVTFRSDHFGPALGLENLYITFSGWWPRRNARIPTGTFKENEAYAVYGRMGDAARRHTLVVASAGNTARAFLRVASENNLPLVIVVPEKNLPELWTVGPRGQSTIVIAAGKGADYSDAIRLSSLLASAPGFLPEGGAKNVARRDGMGTTFLSAAEVMGRIPDHYIQAVGSGTGAIAAWEANLRLADAGMIGPSHPGIRPGITRLHLAQNAPFQLLVDTWRKRSQTVLPLDEGTAKAQIDTIDAKVLANRLPPWSPVGGLFDALTDTNGAMYAITNEQAAQVGARFEELEGIDLEPAARVACAALSMAVTQGAISRKDYVSLNITGGGYLQAKKDLDTWSLTADIVADPHAHTSETIAQAVREIIDERRDTWPARS